MKFSAILLAPLFVASYVSAHGFPTLLIVEGGDSFPLDSPKNAIRPVSTQNPNIGFRNQALKCGPDAKKVPNVIDVLPGQVIDIHWAFDKVLCPSIMIDQG
jgi:hypothetical protein